MLIGNLNPFILNEISLIDTHKKHHTNLTEYIAKYHQRISIINNNNIVVRNHKITLDLLTYKCCYTKILEILTKSSIQSLNYCIEYLAKNRPLHIIKVNNHIFIQSSITGYFENYINDINLIIKNNYIKIPVLFDGNYKTKIIFTPNYSQSRSNKIYMTIQQNKKFVYF